MAQPNRIPAALALAVAVVATAAATGCTAPAVCSAARATAAAIESGADATADAFCGAGNASEAHEPAPTGDGTAPLDPASTVGATISGTGSDGSDEQVPLSEAKEEKEKGQLHESGHFNSGSD